jgi:hypothetical protein
VSSLLKKIGQVNLPLVSVSEDHDPVRFRHEPRKRVPRENGDSFSKCRVVPVEVGSDERYLIRFVAGVDSIVEKDFRRR